MSNATRRSAGSGCISRPVMCFSLLHVPAPACGECVSASPLLLSLSFVSFVCRFVHSSFLEPQFFSVVSLSLYHACARLLELLFLLNSTVSLLVHVPTCTVHFMCTLVSPLNRCFLHLRITVPDTASVGATAPSAPHNRALSAHPLGHCRAFPTRCTATAERPLSAPSHKWSTATSSLQSAHTTASLSSLPPSFSPSPSPHARLAFLGK